MALIATRRGTQRGMKDMPQQLVARLDELHQHREVGTLVALSATRTLDKAGMRTVSRVRKGPGPRVLKQYRDVFRRYRCVVPAPGRWNEIAVVE
jgi:hypothetical protein